MDGWIIPVVALVIASLLERRTRELRQRYVDATRELLARPPELPEGPLTAEDIADLPAPLQKYLQYVGVVGRERVRNARMVLGGTMKTTPERAWMRIKTEQYNSFGPNPARCFFIQGNMGVPVLGLHIYANAAATMEIRLASVLTVADAKGPEMNQGETVTVFNDMCLMAPATLVDTNIEWETLDPLTVKGTFTNDAITVSATLHFDEDGRLVNFVSDDRYMTTTGNTYLNVRWSTPIGTYGEFDGLRLPSHAETVWHLPEGDYCYLKFSVKKVEYNLKSMRR